MCLFVFSARSFNPFQNDWQWNKKPFRLLPDRNRPLSVCSP